MRTHSQQQHAAPRKETLSFVHQPLLEDQISLHKSVPLRIFFLRLQLLLYLDKKNSVLIQHTQKHFSTWEEYFSKNLTSSSVKLITEAFFDRVFSWTGASGAMLKEAVASCRSSPSSRVNCRSSKPGSMLSGMPCELIFSVSHKHKESSIITYTANLTLASELLVARGARQVWWYGGWLLAVNTFKVYALIEWVALDWRVAVTIGGT